MSDRWRDDHHMLPRMLAAAFVVVVAVAAAVALAWSRDGAPDEPENVVAQMQRAYSKVVPGRTTQAELAQLGFDTAHYRSRTLSGLGVQEYFMPRTSAEFDRLDPEVRACFETANRCRALLFPLTTPLAGNFMSAHAAPHQAGRMLFLLRDGRVSYKAMNEV